MMGLIYLLSNERSGSNSRKCVQMAIDQAGGGLEVGRGSRHAPSSTVRIAELILEPH